ncbi:MAG: hypothetical protein BGO06_19035 [Shinella sp. 65-6]|nr:MAG: hypothetical protein BGO06_19035 [Shinella sp. 65-6]
MTGGEWLRTLPGGKAISALGFGCSSLWAKPSFDARRASEILDTLLAQGVNHFDTGPSYAAGEGERRLGRWLSGRPTGDLVITTKVGTNLIDGRIVRGFTPEMMERTFLSSLERLKLERVDVLYLHGPSPADLGEETWRFFERLKARGLIDLSGVNSFDNTVLERTVDTPADVVMLQYNIGDSRNAPMIDKLRQAGKAVLSGTAMARAKFDMARFIPTNREKLWYLLRMLRNEPGFLVSGWRLERRIKATGLPPHEAAIGFLVGDERITSSLFGTTSAAHAKANVAAGRKTMPQEVWTRLQSCA